MTDNDIHNLIDKKNETQFATIENMFRGITNLITAENKDMRTSIDNLTVKVTQQNHSVRKLNEWKAEIVGEEKGKLKTNTETRAVLRKKIQIVMCVIGILALCCSAYFSYKGSKVPKQLIETKNVLKKRIDQQEGVSKVTRSGFVKYNDSGLSDSIKIR